MVRLKYLKHLYLMWGKPSSAEHHTSESLAERRRRTHFRVLVSHAVLFLLLFGVSLYGLWQDPVRISHVAVYGADQSLASIAMAAMRGSYLGVIPRDSVFFVPDESIRAGIVAAHQDIATISIFRNGLDSISIKVSYRVPIARWCGATPPEVGIATSSVAGGSGGDCYFFDANGFIYMKPDTRTLVNAFVIYEPLAQDVSTTSPIGALLPHADLFPATFDFARKLATLGAPVSAVVFSGDEVNEYLTSGTRITYVLGNEQDAYTALMSARNGMNFSNGSIDYADLRFPGKVYIKKK